MESHLNIFFPNIQQNRQPTVNVRYTGTDKVKNRNWKEIERNEIWQNRMENGETQSIWNNIF